MGISTGGDRNGVKSEINVTPLVDIVLVLLIIFLVLTPIKMRHLTIEVPRELDQDTEIQVDAKLITVLLRADGTVKISDGNEEVEVPSLFELARAIRPMLEKRALEKVVFVDFEDQVLYGDAVVTMDTIKGAGAEKVALKIKKEQPGQ
jgi:biopolymer transport protein TolR